MPHTAFILERDDSCASVCINLDMFHVSAIRTETTTFKQQLKVIFGDLWRQMRHTYLSSTQLHLLRTHLFLIRTRCVPHTQSLFVSYSSLEKSFA